MWVRVNIFLCAPCGLPLSQTEKGVRVKHTHTHTPLWTDQNLLRWMTIPTGTECNHFVHPQPGSESTKMVEKNKAETTHAVGASANELFSVFSGLVGGICGLIVVWGFEPLVLVKGNWESFG